MRPSRALAGLCLFGFAAIFIRDGQQGQQKTFPVQFVLIFGPGKGLG